MKILAFIVLLSLTVSSAHSRETYLRPQSKPTVLMMSYWPKKTQTAQAFSGICRTWNGFVCFIYPPAPVGTPCWCQTVYGPMQGVVTFQ
jgi:hypothetical protein